MCILTLLSTETILSRLLFLGLFFLGGGGTLFSLLSLSYSSVRNQSLFLLLSTKQLIQRTERETNGRVFVFWWGGTCFRESQVQDSPYCWEMLSSAGIVVTLQSHASPEL